MAPELVLEDSDFESRAVSPFREMGAYEALWAEPDPAFKSLSVRFARHPDSVSSDFVFRAEAHDSGLCTADAATRRRFASDLLNLTLASPDVNHNWKKHHHAAQWMLSMNRFWFAARVAEVQHKYAVTIDAWEVNALERVLSACASTEMIVRSCEDGRSTAAPKAPRSVPSSQHDRCLASVGQQRERTNHLPRGTARRHRPGVARLSGLPVHARQRR